MTKINLSDFERSKLLEWQYKFNRWEYPEDFPVPKPPQWDTCKNYGHNDEITRHTLMQEHWDELKRIIPYKESLRYHHCKSFGVNKFLFEMWWISDIISHYFRKFYPNFYFDFYGLVGIRKSYSIFRFK